MKVEIKYLGSPIPAKLNTIDGMKELNEEGKLTVDLETAVQMIDNTVFGCDIEMKVLHKKIKELEKEKLEESIKNNEDEEILKIDAEESEDEDKDLNEEDLNPELDESEELDEDDKELLKKLPKMKRKELDKVAEEIGIDVTKYERKSDLIKKMVSILKGKEEA